MHLCRGNNVGHPFNPWTKPNLDMYHVWPFYKPWAKILTHHKPWSRVRMSILTLGSKKKEKEKFQSKRKQKKEKGRYNKQKGAKIKKKKKKIRRRPKPKFSPINKKVSLAKHTHFQRAQFSDFWHSVLSFSFPFSYILITFLSPPSHCKALLTMSG